MAPMTGASVNIPTLIAINNYASSECAGDPGRSTPRLSQCDYPKFLQLYLLRGQPNCFQCFRMLFSRPQTSSDYAPKWNLDQCYLVLRSVLWDPAKRKLGDCVFEPLRLLHHAHSCQSGEAWTAVPTTREEIPCDRQTMAVVLDAVCGGLCHYWWGIGC